MQPASASRAAAASGCSPWTGTARIAFICAVSAPFDLALATADRLGMTLMGFLRGSHFNVYSGRERVRGLIGGGRRLRSLERSDEQALIDGLFVVPVNNRPRGLLGYQFDGRFRSMDTRELQAVVERLVPEVDLAGVDHVLGVPEGGTAVAFAFAQAVGLPLVLSTRMDAQLPDAIYFEEPHSVSADRHNWIYGLRRGDHVVIVDDEISTGHTLLNAVRALRAAGITVDRLVVLLASSDPQTAERLAAEGITVHAAARMPIDVSNAIVGSVVVR